MAVIPADKKKNQYIYTKFFLKNLKIRFKRILTYLELNIIVEQ
jgi:hypothetical protein